MEGMSKYVWALFRSKNPLAIALGIVLVFVCLTWSGAVLVSRAQDFVGQYETREEHKRDLEEKVSSFRKDVKIALLENNKALLDEIDKRMRR